MACGDVNSFVFHVNIKFDAFVHGLAEIEMRRLIPHSHMHFQNEAPGRSLLALSLALRLERGANCGFSCFFSFLWVQKVMR